MGSVPVARIGVRPGGSLGGEQIEGERVEPAPGCAGSFGVRRRAPRMEGHGERRRQDRERTSRDGFAGRDRRHGCGRRGGAPLGGGPGGVAVREGGEDLPLAQAAHEEQDEGVLVEQPCRLVAERGGVLAGVTVVRAGAVGDQIARRRQQVRHLRQRVRNILVEQGRDVVGPGGRGREEIVPVVVGERPQTDLRAVRAGSAAVDVRHDTAGGHRDRVDVAAARIRPAPDQPGPVQGGVLQRVHPGVPPPACGEVLTRQGLERGERAPAVVVAGGSRGAAARAHEGLRRETRSASSRSVSSVRAASPEPRTASARARLAASMSAILSSTVPSAISRWTWTGWVWPMR